MGAKSVTNPTGRNRSELLDLVGLAMSGVGWH